MDSDAKRKNTLFKKAQEYAEDTFDLKKYCSELLKIILRVEIIVFGTGKIGKAMLPFLEKEYHILFFVDNDEKKWNTTFGKYMVEFPEKIKRYNCSVVIASTMFCLQIDMTFRCQMLIYARIRFKYYLRSKNFPFGDILAYQ